MFCPRYLLLYPGTSMNYKMSLVCQVNFTTKYLSKPILQNYKLLNRPQKINKSSIANIKLKNNFCTLQRFVNVERKLFSEKCNVRIFVLTSQISATRNIHPFVWIVLNPILKLGAILSGRGFRKWWKDLPPKKRTYFLHILRRNRNKIGIGAFIMSFLSWIYYESHIQETPITKRKRFIAFTPEQLEKVNEFEFQQIMETMKFQVLPPNHPASRRVATVVRRILDANVDIVEVKKKDWKIAVVESEVENAFVLPSGDVFVFTGMLNLCSNDDQLGTVLAHEIAHCLMAHGVENLSFTHLLDLIAILFITAIWAILPSDSISILIHWLFQKIIQISLQLPYSRKIETEADEVGLQLAAKACFDVRESSAFWAKMSILNKTFGTVPEVEFLSTHPSHETRSDHLDSIMEKALDTRRTCGCPLLKSADPRLNVEAISKLLEKHRSDSFHLHQKPRSIFVP